MDEHEMTALYLVDALDDLERRRYEEHLDDCAGCQAELIELGHGIDVSVSNSTESLKGAGLAEIDDAPSVSRRFAGLAVGLTAAVAALSVVVAVAISGEPDLVEQIHGADDVVALEVEASPFTNNRIVYSREVGRAIFVADDLPELGTDRTYQLWLIDDGNPRPAGIFLPEDGHATVVLDGTAETGAIVGLTVEPVGGSNQPTGEMLVAQPLG